MSEAPDVVVVGSACRDLADGDPRGWRLGGGASYSALALARLGVRVGALVVADDLADASEELATIRDAGVEVVRQPGSRGPVFINVEMATGRIQRTPQVSDPVDPSSLPHGWRDAKGWLFAPVAAEIPDAWAAVPPPDALVALGWQGMLRVLEPGAEVRPRLPGDSAVVRRADLAGVGRDDFDPAMTTIHDLLALMRPGATLLVTDGARGGEAVEAGEGGAARRRRSWPGIPTARYVDAVGAGDTFLAGVFGALIDPSLTASWDGPDPELRFGAACGSLIVEGAGLSAVPGREDAIARMHAGEPG